MKNGRIGRQAPGAVVAASAAVAAATAVSAQAALFSAPVLAAVGDLAVSAAHAWKLD